MAKKKKFVEVTALLRNLLNDPENIDSGFKESKPPELKITAKGEVVGKERSEPRVAINGSIFLHFSNSKSLKVQCRDLSPSGIGIEIHQKVKSYRIGSRIGLEFAQPHKLQGLMFIVEMRRVDTDPEGNSQIGFRFVSSNRFLEQKLGEYLSYVLSSDPWIQG